MAMKLLNSEFILREKRYSWIDYDKGISIILVAYGHCITNLTNQGIDLNSAPFFTYFGMVMYGFRMPLFFIISGVFLSGSLQRKGLGGYVYGRSNNILYPFLIWGIMETTVQLASAYHKVGSFTPSLYLSLFTHPREIGTGHLWYLNALFSIGIVYAFLKKKLKMGPAVQIPLGLLLYCLSAYWHINDLEVGMFVDFCAFYLFFALGDSISSVVLDQRNVLRFASLKVFFPLFIIFVGVQYYCTHLNLTLGHGEINYVEHKKPFLFLVEALIGCILSVNVSFQLQKHKIVRFLRVVGYNSLYIYCMQILFMLATSVFLIRVVKLSSVPILVLLVWASGVLPPMVFYSLSLRYNLWWLFTFIKPEREIAALKNKAPAMSDPVPAEKTPTRVAERL
jgi:fucose 4-O-acetylase-like acetyltransferase